jgi:hypothetical protein
MLAAAVLALLGLPGFYARQAHRAGRLGVAGFGLSLVVTAILCHILLHEAFVAPRLAREAAAQALVAPGGPLAHAAFASMGALYPVLLVGFLASAPLLGLATLRAGVLPRPSGGLLVLCLVPNLLSALPPPAALAALPHWLTSMVAWGEYLLFLGYAWGGYALWTEAVPAAGYSARSVEPSAAA